MNIKENIYVRNSLFYLIDVILIESFINEICFYNNLYLVINYVNIYIDKNGKILNV